MSNKLSFWKIILLGPLSFLYGIVIRIRNFCYENKIWLYKEYSIPIISIGNISVGGTGKTPHTEYILKMLKEEFSVAVLSRGYKRKSKGFRIVETTCTALEAGDEPLQIKLKFPDAIVAVDGNRRRGIERLLDMYPELNLIILDDAFQHRKVKPGLSILLNNYHYPISSDYLLPLGRLRESKHSSIRAHIIFVTKCPENIKPIEKRIIHKEIDVLPFQYLFFSLIKYKEILPVFPEEENLTDVNNENLKNFNVLTFTGIAITKGFTEYLEPKCKSFSHLKFSDHRNFTKKDIELISDHFAATSEPGILITTEKDMVRFKNNDIFPEELKKYLYYLPIEVLLLLSEDEKKQFDNQIFSYVRNNKRYSKLYKNAYQE